MFPLVWPQASFGICTPRILLGGVLSSGHCPPGCLHACLGGTHAAQLRSSVLLLLLLQGKVPARHPATQLPRPAPTSLLRSISHVGVVGPRPCPAGAGNAAVTVGTIANRSEEGSGAHWRRQLPRPGRDAGSSPALLLPGTCQPKPPPLPSYWPGAGYTPSQAGS